MKKTGGIFLPSLSSWWNPTAQTPLANAQKDGDDGGKSAVGGGSCGDRAGVVAANAERMNALEMRSMYCGDCGCVPACVINMLIFGGLTLRNIGSFPIEKYR